MQDESSTQGGLEVPSPPSESEISESTQKNAAPSPEKLDATNEDAVEDSETAEVPKSPRFYATIFFLCIASTVAAMDSVIIGPCLSAIAADLQTTSLETFWIGTAYLLACTVTIPIYGTMSNIFGRKPLIMIGMALFLFASILCSTAKNGPWLVAARTVQGLGGGALFNMVYVIISDITTMRERGKYLAFGALSWGLGVSGGVPLGGAISQYTTWRWVFYINIPLCVVVMAGLFWSLHLQLETSSLRSKLLSIDFLGLGLFTAATASFLVGITGGGTLFPWKSASCIASLVVGGVLYVAFVLIEWKVAKQPMIPLRIFNDRTANSGFLGVFLHGMIVWSFAYYMVAFFQGGLNHSRLRASLELLTTFAYVSPSAVVASIIIKRTLRFKPTITTGWLFFAAGLAAQTQMYPNSSPGVLYGPRVIAGIGGGMLFPSPLFAIQVNQASEDVGIATSMQVFFRSLGSAFGVGIGGAIFQNQWTREVAKRVGDGRIPAEFELSSELAEVAYDVLNGFPEEVHYEYRWVYAYSVQTIWWVMFGLAVLGLVASLGARNESLDRGFTGNQGFDHGKGKQDGVKAEEVV